MESLTERYQRMIAIEIDNLAKKIKEAVYNQIDKYSLQYRIKEEKRIIQKLGHKSYNSIFGLYDIYAFRFLVKDIVDAYHLCKLLQKKFPCVLTKNYLEEYKIIPQIEGNGYKCLHLILLYNYCRFEVQILTKQMYEFNETQAPHKEYLQRKYAF